MLKMLWLSIFFYLAKQISSDRLKTTELPVKDNGFGINLEK